MTAVERSVSRWGRDFDPERRARLELAMWKAYDRGRPALLCLSYRSLSEALVGGEAP